MFTVGGVSYRCDAILKLAANTRVTAIVPPFGDRSEIVVEDNDGHMARAVRISAFAIDDAAGARESARQEQALKKQLRALEAEVPVLRTTRKLNRKRPDPPVVPTCTIQPPDPNYEAYRQVTDPDDSPGQSARHSSRLSKRRSLTIGIQATAC